LADEADARLMRGEPVGPLHGLPFAFKDMQPAVGFPCTMGSPILRNNQPLADSVLVERIRRAGALPIGKTNVPSSDSAPTPTMRCMERRATRGIWPRARAARAAARAPRSRQPVAARRRRRHGGCCAIRRTSTTGRLPALARHCAERTVGAAFENLSVSGPMARTVADAALLLSVIAGADARDPASLPIDPGRFASRSDATSPVCASPGVQISADSRSTAACTWSWKRAGAVFEELAASSRRRSPTCATPTPYS